MKIQSIATFAVAVPLVKPFKTALRTVTTAHSIYVVMTDESGRKGYGEAPPTHVITGETLISIKHTIDAILAPALIGKDFLDANQGWAVKEAVKAIRHMEDAGLNIELIEQPVRKHDFEGLKYVTNHTYTPIMADESVFSPVDLRRLLEMRAADLVNLKLMKSGGIYKAMQMNKMDGVECMVGSMIETKLGLSAAAHFAASQRNITRYDFDAPLMFARETIDGGIDYQGRVITFTKDAGLGIKGMKLD